MTHTDSDVVVALYIRDLLQVNKNNLLLEDVLYGNHNMVPHGSAAVITASGKRRALAGVSGPGGRTENVLSIDIVLHYSKVGDEETERRAVDALSYEVEKLLHADTTLGGNIIHGYVTLVERGETIMANNSQFRSVRLMYVATTKTYLSPPAAPV